ncbi:hypothetical protein BKP35_09435 [Anaerobacillus arseniciselenatis]|uniref:DUF2564 domain-containing protein n=1 Tax=Anaerobacillus arseniciselenatis TaxID=85682 RepID=A0A1S2LL40_9BACI|nr:hypothetical protein [Anaerobacillus arseniciselenatis]OIJ12793.1 hypothetical protein BKP35_09435 [Anaerobacillus arseniciselenatis]
MTNIPIEQAMLAIQQSKLAIQQGLIKANPDQFNMVEKQLLAAQEAISEAKLKVSANEEQILNQANQSVEDAIVQLHESHRDSNLQQG